MSARLTAKELAARLGVNTDTICRWARLKTIPSIKLPGAKKRGQYRFDMKAIEAWEELHTRDVRK